MATHAFNQVLVKAHRCKFFQQCSMRHCVKGLSEVGKRKKTSSNVSSDLSQSSVAERSAWTVDFLHRSPLVYH